MYLRASKQQYTNGEFNHETDNITQRLLSSPMTPNEQELMHLHCSSSLSNEINNNSDKKYFWNDIPTLQTKMLDFLPTHHGKRSYFQDTSSMITEVRYMEFLQPETRWCKAYRATQDFLHEQQWSNSTIHVNFFRGLLDCPPMQLGFHTLAIPEWCYCPLSLPAWCRKNQIDYHFATAPKNKDKNNYSPHQLYYCDCKDRSPNAFAAHIEAMKRRPVENEPDRPALIEELHTILHVYLLAYYEHYLIPRLHHHGLYALQSDKYNRGIAAKFARLHRWMDLGLQKRQRLQQETLEQQKKLEASQKVKNFLEKVLHKKDREIQEQRNALFQKAQKVLGISDVAKAKERQPYSRIAYQARRQEYLTGAGQLLVQHHVKHRSSSEKVKFKNSSLKYMRKLWEQRDHQYLFADSICTLRESFFVGMDASPHLETTRIDKAVDKGGPTRQFLSVLWNYLPRVAIQINNLDGNIVDFALFTESDNHLQPRIDVEIDKLQEYAKKEAYRCYRALGRILGFCILHEYHISNNVLSKIHRNYLLRGVTPKNGYDKSDLFYDLKESIGQETVDNKKIFDALQHMDFENQAVVENEMDLETLLRKNVQEMYIDQNTFFLRAIEEGMRLDFIEGDHIPQIFKNIHSWRVDELLFGRTKFDVEDVISSLEPIYADLEKEPNNQETKARVEIQKKVLRKNELNKVEGAFVNVIRSLSEKSDKKQDFLASFVLFVTGYDYLPVTLPMKVEFNHAEMPSNDALPVSHSCTHTLKLPGLAYDSDEELIRTRLTTSLDYFKKSKSAFNMA